MDIDNEYGGMDIEADEYAFPDDCIGECLYPVEDFKDPANVVIVYFSYSVEGIGWGAGYGGHISTFDVEKIAQGMSKLLSGDSDYFISRMYEQWINPNSSDAEEVKKSPEYIIEIKKLDNGLFRVFFYMHDELGDHIQLHKDIDYEELRKQADLWMKYNEQCPVRNTPKEKIVENYERLLKEYRESDE